MTTEKSQAENTELRRAFENSCRSAAAEEHRALMFAQRFEALVRRVSNALSLLPPSDVEIYENPFITPKRYRYYGPGSEPTRELLDKIREALTGSNADIGDDMSDKETTSGLVVPDDVQVCVDQLPDAVRNRLSFYDIDCVRKPYMQRIAELEDAARRIEALEAAIMDAPHDSFCEVNIMPFDYESDVYPAARWRDWCNCWKMKALENLEGNTRK